MSRRKYYSDPKYIKFLKVHKSQPSGNNAGGESYDLNTTRREGHLKHIDLCFKGWKSHYSRESKKDSQRYMSIHHQRALKPGYEADNESLSSQMTFV